MINLGIERVQNLIARNNANLWIMYCDEKSDPYFIKYISSKTIVPAIALINKDNCFLIVNSLDSDNLKEVGQNVSVLVYENENQMIDLIKQSIIKLNYPSPISLSYTTMNDIQTDIIGYGTYLYLNDILSSIYEKNETYLSFCSAENLIYALKDSKDETELSRMRMAANRALQILEDTFKKISVGMSEKEIVDVVHQIFMEKPSYFEKEGVINEEYAWDEDLCPIVLVGPSLKKGGHATSSDEVLKKGYTIYFDFGVTLTFQDGNKVSSDLQRMGYVLNDNEETPPQEVMRVFNTLIDAIEKGIKNIRHGLKGYEIDKIVRSVILDAGYPDYNHSTGHAIGEEAHNPGALLGKQEKKQANLTIQLNGVYTIEPRISIINGGSIEEMVQVTENGGLPLCKPQKSLYIIT